MPTRIKKAPATQGVSAMRRYLHGLASDGCWPLLEALPVTRDLGDRFGVSNVSAFRVLAELRESGLFWQAGNGRYYRAEARRLIEKPKPVACLLRRLQAWTEVGREILQGADEACGSMDRALLLVHDRALFHQADPNSPTSTAPHEKLQESLEDFLLLHGERTSGVLLDELWPDAVLKRFEGRLRSGVILYRTTRLPFLGNVAADCAMAARMVVETALRRKDREIFVVSPPSEYIPSLEMAGALKKAARENNIPCREWSVLAADLPEIMDKMLGDKKRRILLAATEDNTAAGVLSTLRGAGWRDPGKIGLLSTMGSRIALREGITATRFDFQMMGREAAEIAMQSAPLRRKIKPTFEPGSTT